jgi:hypothetical protein
LAQSCLVFRGSPDRDLTFFRTDPVLGEQPMMDECITLYAPFEG